ncbi:hypothetical protein BY996DRAFT_6410950 [Phakopsora pachyrhizi]|nr:hypothetical protein BY996DRAFT_6410950 [Phakopsora pachyrhizi]
MLRDLSQSGIFYTRASKLNTSANRLAAVVYLLMHNSHKMDLLGKSIAKLQGFYTSGGLNLSDVASVFISPEVESYTKGTDSGSIVIGKSLFSMTMKKLNNKPNEWKKKYLPIPFGDEDN